MKTLLVGVLLIGLAVGGVIGFCLGIKYAKVETVVVEKPVAQKAPETPLLPQIDTAARLEKAKEENARINAKGLSELCKIYRLNNDEWPADIATLTKEQPNGSPSLIEKNRTVDPWDKPYQLRIEGDGIVVFTIHNNNTISSSDR